MEQAQAMSNKVAGRHFLRIRSPLLVKFFCLTFLLMIEIGSISPRLALASNAAPPEKILVAASILPLADFCRHLGGDRVEVQVLIPPGASPHAFEPAPSVIARAGRALVFVYIGAGLEPWAERLLKARGTKGLTVVEVAASLPLLSGDDDHHGGAVEEKGADSDHGHHHATGNPHIWLDPVIAQEICTRIARAFMQVDPEHRAEYEANLSNYLASLKELDQDYRTQISTWRLKAFISFHPAFSYLAKRYGLREVGVLEPAPGREPTPRHLQAIVRTVRQYGIRVIFTEPQLNPRMAEVIAQEAGARVLVLDPMGGKPPYGSDYLKLMRFNLAEMAEAMK
jgi:zinc transport system substrate-binding protein